MNRKQMSKRSRMRNLLSEKDKRWSKQYRRWLNARKRDWAAMEAQPIARPNRWLMPLEPRPIVNKDISKAISNAITDMIIYLMDETPPSFVRFPTITLTDEDLQPKLSPRQLEVRPVAEAAANKADSWHVEIQTLLS